MMKIIQTQLKDMPSSLLAELGTYRYSVFARGEGWSIPPRLSTPGQEYDRFDRSDVRLIADCASGHLWLRTSVTVARAGSAGRHGAPLISKSVGNVALFGPP